MAADRFVTCPKCRLNNEVEVTWLKGRFDEAYGTVPREEFMTLVTKLREANLKCREETFKEDFRCWWEADCRTLNIVYLGECTSCGHTINFHHRIHPTA